jgi:hypothetical protein
VFSLVKFDKVSTYFSEPGSSNTDDVIAAVARRIEENGTRTVVVASTSGETGIKFAEALKGKAKVIDVSHEKMNPKLKDRMVKLGAVPVDETHLPLHSKGMDDFRNAFYVLGQGFKVAIEVILIAADKGLLDLHKDVIGVAGTGTGADTAIVARATATKDAFGDDSSKKLEVREILAMPLKKEWWD